MTLLLFADSGAVFPRILMLLMVVGFIVVLEGISVLLSLCVGLLVMFSFLKK